jgi:tetratricopeptide (TPR) repeat protein
MYVFYRRLGSHRDALKTLDEALETIPHQHPEAASFEDERGTRFQHLGRYEEAEEAHRRSLEMSREAGYDVGVEASLNNLGELYRRTERPEQALPFYREAEEFARGRGDKQECLSVAHNRALALSDLGRLDEAKDLIEEIKAQAETTGSTRELARALHGEAILAWQETPSREMLSLFQEAMQRAQELGEYGQAVDAAANYGSLLLNFDEAGMAVRTLQPLEGNVYQTDLPRQYEYFATLADAYERLGDFPNARSCWSTAHRIGREMGTPDPILTSLVSLAGIDLRTGYAEEADQKIERALERAPNASDKTGVLLTHLDTVLAEDEESRIEAVQEQIHDLAAHHDLDELHIDMQMKIGDYYLNKDRRRHLEGFQHYVAGLARATDLLISDGALNPMSRIGVHIVVKITSLDAEDRAEHLSRLLEQLELTKWSMLRTPIQRSISCGRSRPQRDWQRRRIPLLNSILTRCQASSWRSFRSSFPMTRRSQVCKGQTLSAACNNLLVPVISRIEEIRAVFVHHRVEKVLGINLVDELNEVTRWNQHDHPFVVALPQPGYIVPSRVTHVFVG